MDGHVEEAFLLFAAPSLPGSTMEFCLENPLSSLYSLNTHPFHDEEDDQDRRASLLLLFSAEEDHMPCAHYLACLKEGGLFNTIRRDAVSSISRLSSGPGPILLYLAVNYVDRFLSCQRFKRAKPWVSRILAVSCFSLAAKMLGLELPTGLAMQGDDSSVRGSRAVCRMEVIILGALGWRMRSVTPFSFLPFFASLFELKDVPLRRALRERAIAIILKAQHDVEILRFKPSLIAASALLLASHELFPVQFPRFRTAICGCPYVNEGKLMECYCATQEVAAEGYESATVDVSGPGTPRNVHDRQFSTASSSSSADDGGAPKRRKIDALPE